MTVAAFGRHPAGDHSGMFARHARHDTAATVDDRGTSLARGPVLLAGTILFAYGLLGFLTNSDLPRDQFADGTVQGESWLGLEVNGWTNFFICAMGGLLLFGAAEHLLARTMALLVGGISAACCVIAVIDGQDVLGLAAANWATKLGFGIAAVYLLIVALLPRTGGRRRRTVVEPDEVTTAATTPTGRFRRGGSVAVDEQPAVTSGQRRR